MFSLFLMCLEKERRLVWGAVVLPTERGGWSVKAREKRRVNVLGLWVWGWSKREKRDGVAAVVRT